MHDLPIHKRIYYRYLGLIYSFTYQTERRKFLGIRLGPLLRTLAFLPLVVVWLQDQGSLILGLAFLFGMWVRWLYWRSSRAGHSKFVEGKTAVTPNDDLEPLPPNSRVQLKATGIFSVNEREEWVLLRPAEYWQVPLGEHTVMVEPTPGRFLYQFFNAISLQDLQRGWLIHGSRLMNVLAVTFLSTWGTKPLSMRAIYQGVDGSGQDAKKRTIYLCFEDKKDERAVWHTILHDAREKRKTHYFDE